MSNITWRERPLLHGMHALLQPLEQHTTDAGVRLHASVFAIGTEHSCKSKLELEVECPITAPQGYSAHKDLFSKPPMMTCDRE